jgi:DNA primase
VSKNIWNCFSECKRGGNVLDFIARMENVSIHAAALKAIEWFHIDADMAGTSRGVEQDGSPTTGRAKSMAGERGPAAAVEEKSVPNKPLKFRLDKLDLGHPYLQERGLTFETIVNFGLGYCAKGMMAERIAIPIHNPEGNVVAYAGRHPGDPKDGIPKYKLPQGFRKSLELFNIDRASKESPDHPLVIVEGFFDCMKLYQHGCRRVVALMGSTMSAAQEELIRKLTDHQGQVIVMLDEDEAGQTGRDEIAVRLAKFVFVRIHVFEEEGFQPEHMSAEEVASLLI